MKLRTRISLILAGVALPLSIVCCLGIATIYIVGGYNEGGKCQCAEHVLRPAGKTAPCHPVASYPPSPR